MKILVLNGPNLNMLGERETSIYGKVSLGKIEKRLKDSSLGNEIMFFQSNHEGAIIDRIHKAFEEKIGYIILNAGAYAHTSIALRDALLAVKIPFIEVHITNVYAREEYRKTSYISDIAEGVISGFKDTGYSMALGYILSKYDTAKQL